MSTQLEDGRRCGGKRWIPVVCIFTFAIVASSFLWAGGLEHASSPVTVAEAWHVVVEELRSRGFQEEQLPRAEDLELPVAVPARAGRKLRVSSMCWDANHRRVRFRLRCSEAGVCLPFLVYVRAVEQTRAPSCELERQWPSPSPSMTQVPASAPIVRAGERATAVLVAAGLRMTAAVTCLDRGARGEVIRVRGPEGRIFRARVAGPALVEALRQ